ncbi:MAG: DUF1257 domain-containing protein [Planctomycetia bacterium]|nr:DUF1257 domain-containing protein [Planctomycetia bacterium]
MSHVVSIKTRLHDPAAISVACRRLGLTEPTHGTATMYAGQTAEGLLVQLPGWKFAIAIDIQSGEVKADNFSGHWGDQVELDRFLQSYAVEKCRIEARKQGHVVTEHQLQDGSIRLQIQEGA